MESCMVSTVWLEQCAWELDDMIASTAWCNTRLVHCMSTRIFHTIMVEQTASCCADVPQMFNVSYPGAPPNLNRPSMLGAAAPSNLNRPSMAGAEGSSAEGSSTSPKISKDNIFRCPICFEDLHRDDVFCASMCGHDMCRGCARQMVLTAIRRVALTKHLRYCLHIY